MASQGHESLAEEVCCRPNLIERAAREVWCGEQLHASRWPPERCVEKREMCVELVALLKHALHLEKAQSVTGEKEDRSKLARACTVKRPARSEAPHGRWGVELGAGRLPAFVTPWRFVTLAVTSHLRYEELTSAPRHSPNDIAADSHAGFALEVRIILHSQLGSCALSATARDFSVRRLVRLASLQTNTYKLRRPISWSRRCL